jgi:hypothetical protein
MPRLAILNMVIGFATIFVVSAGGAFIANDLAVSFLREGQFSGSWLDTLLQSAHGHLGLMSLVQISFGLTMAHSKLSLRIKKYQTSLFCCGFLAMGPMMLLRAWYGPRESGDIIGLIIGVLLSGYMLAGLSHAFGLGKNLIRR